MKICNCRRHTPAAGLSSVALAFCAFFAWAATAGAATTIAQYNFETDLSSSANESSVTASEFGWTSEFGEEANRSGVSASVFVRSSSTADSEATALTQPSFFTFTVTPDSGTLLDLTSLDFATIYNLGVPFIEGDPTATFFVRSSIDGFSANIGASFDEENNGLNGLGTSTSRSIDLTGLSTINSATEFRFYVYDDSVNFDRTVRIDDVSLSATVTVIPEPSAFVLFAGAFGWMAVFSRRRRA